MKEMVLSVDVENLTIRYFRTEGMLDDEGSKTRIYGISAAKYIGDEKEEEQDAGFISADMAYVDELIAVLGKNTVTPMVLCEVLDEILSA